ncbi:alpha/beta hydrolase [Nocardioides plantarum]|uniref:Alpha/beta hydrolase fold domain-containing protein n=1 Tax=Nocardioides plantarum TaxID=29299 RepID=A0ABV5K5E1_9ACTN|nr:alpha/beta hydrolase [Nocardioides plantarum]
MGFLRRQVVTAALTANALRPLPGYEVAVPSFFAGWLTTELAPHVLALTAADATAHARGSRRDWRGLLLAGASAAGLAYLVRQSNQVREVAESALTDALGPDYQQQLDALPTPADLAVPWRRLAYPFRVRDKAVHVERDIAYNDHGTRGRLDVYAPAGGVPEGGAPVLLQVHGGAWRIGKKDQQGLPLMNHLAAKGWVCVAINYRLAPRDPFPAHVIDVKQAIAWIKEHIADYGGDPSYVAITGGSAGGHLTALAALTAADTAWQPGFEDADTSVQCAVPHYGVYDFAGSTGLRSAELMRDRFLAPKVLLKTWRDAPEEFEAASPILRITPDAPDFFVLHGAHDSLVDVEQARLFVGRLRDVSDSSVVYAELPGAQHAFDVFPSIRSSHVVHAIDRYLHWHWNTWRAGLDHDDQVSDPVTT